ncbi:MAG TPA: glutamine--tRNA ligase/YqeY domain fusion protein [Desulfuromonadales bacterium]|nr:glutamine--tRNA ligase/YqeY domain fusion protein [Desulfuromonadales bacterium]
MTNTETAPAANFIRNIIARDIEEGRNDGRVITRFPPEPNGYLHIGHAKSICLNFSVALENNGRCHLRFDDTNPTREEAKYVEAITRDIHWLGYDWGEHLYYASDYYEQLYEWAVQLIRDGRAYVDDLTPEQIREYRGTLTEPGEESPSRDRSVEQNLDLFARMRAGEFAEGSRSLRAKIDMSAPNINMRDPVLYRIQKSPHHRTGEKWCIYPMYDFAHPLSDAIEHITHSLCTLEFEDHRPLYNWLIENLPVPAQPQQIEFARLNLGFTVMSKRKLLKLVQEGHVSGWDDPRMPTIAGMRRRGFTAAAIRTFCERIGVGKAESWIDMSVLEDCVREDLNEKAPRAMGVLDPLKVVITNYPEDETEEFEAPLHPQKPEMGTRKIPFSREVYIERSDFMEEPPKKFFRLSPGREVRLRCAYFITCHEVVRDPQSGEVTELRCTYDPHSRGGASPDGRKVKGTIHWVSAPHALDTEIRLYDRLFVKDNPSDPRDENDFLSYINPASLQVLTGCKLEPGLGAAEPQSLFQFERMGYFIADAADTKPGRPVFNRAVTLRDTWAKMAKKD